MRLSSDGGIGPKRSASSSRSMISWATSRAPATRRWISILAASYGHVVARHVGVHREVHPHRLDDLLGRVAGEEAHRLVDHPDVQLEAHGRHMPRLLVAEQVARAADLQVAHRDLEAGAELGVVGERGQALAGLLRERRRRGIEEVCVGALARSVRRGRGSGRAGRARARRRAPRSACSRSGCRGPTRRSSCRRARPPRRAGSRASPARAGPPPSGRARPGCARPAPGRARARRSRRWSRRGCAGRTPGRPGPARA